MIHETRIKALNTKELRQKSYALYWMQASQRAEYNHALEFALREANSKNVPLVVYFGLTDEYPEANQRHYAFMLQGLKETQTSLSQRAIQMVIGHESPEIGVVRMAKNASIVVCDRGYLRHQRQWRQRAALNIDCPLIEVECDAVVPIETASLKEEYTAATLRPKIRKLLPHYLARLEQSKAKVSSLHMEFENYDISDIQKALAGLDIDRSVSIVDILIGGTSEARKHLTSFIEHKLVYYSEHRNDPNLEGLSNMSPYLHFGQISSLYIALKVAETGIQTGGAYLEELIVRRELSFNFVFYNQKYDSYECLPSWTKKTLEEHIKDRREYIYSLEELESARTHDPFWNAAQKEMMDTGKMHGYMRMYWGKKILEWTENPRVAFDIALYLNNKYELDGRDPNGFTGVSWCFGKHDRPWASRPIFGNIRYMSTDGLKRKFDADRYTSRYR